jgi:hypothetical protein
MSQYFDLLLDNAISTISENIEKKWPHIQKQLLAALLDEPGAGGRNDARQGLLSGYKRATDHEAAASTVKLRNYQQHRGAYGGAAASAKKAGVPREQRPPTRREYILEYFKDFLVEADPVAYASKGRKTPYVNHVLKWVLNGTAVLPEDCEQLRELLKVYQKLKHNKGGEVPDLAAIDNPGELRSMIMSYSETDTYGVLTNKRLPEIVPGIETYRLDTWEEAKDILCDSGWCVRDEDMFEEYNPPFHIFVSNKDGKRKRVGLLNLQSGELMDVYNRPLESRELAHLAPIIDYIIENDNGVTSSNEEIAATFAPIIHLLPKTVEWLYSHSLATAAQNIWPGRCSGYFVETYIDEPQLKPLVDRWPERIENRIKKDPSAFLAYAVAITDNKRIPDLEEELIDVAHVYFDRDLEYIIGLIEYFGDRMEMFNGEWPLLQELVQMLKQYDLEKEVFSLLRYTTKNGMRAFLTLAGEEWFGDTSKRDVLKAVSSDV